MPLITSETPGTKDSVQAIERDLKAGTIDQELAFRRLAVVYFAGGMSQEDAVASAKQQIAHWAPSPLTPPPTTKKALTQQEIGTILSSQTPVGPAGPGQPSATGKRVTWPTGGFEQAYPQAAWRTAYGLPSYGRNPFQEWLSSQAAPAFASYIGSQYRPENPLVGDFSPLAGGWGESAKTTLRGMRGVSEPQQELWMSEIMGAPGEEGGAGQAALYNLIAAALGKGGVGYTSPIAERKARRIGPLAEQWQQETLAGTKGPSLLDFLLAQFGQI